MPKADTSFPYQNIADKSQFTVVDLLTLRILMNYNWIILAAIAFLFLTLLSIPFFQALGWVGYIAATTLIIFAQLRFSKYWFAFFLSITLLLNCYQLFKIF